MKNTTKIDENIKKILVIGANGFLGTNLLYFQKFPEKFHFKFKIIAADIKNTNLDKKIPFFSIDITDFDETSKKIVEISPDIVILTAAMTDVDQNELDKELAAKINTSGPKNVLKACEIIDSKLVFMSTDFVFDGSLTGRYYNELDTPNPISHYAKTKFSAEEVIINANSSFLICRTAVLYGWNPHKLNFITWILNKLENKEEINMSTNQLNNPTFVPNLAEIILKLIEKKASGIFHTAGDGQLSRYEMALKCAEIFGYDERLILPIEHLNQRAIRPNNTGLDITKLKNLIGTELPILSLEDGLKIMKKRRI
jgi:dTDP-4-dehydrorhamnose reductase